MISTIRDRLLRLALGIRNEPPAELASPQDSRFPPFFPDTSTTRHGIVLVRIATWLLACYGVLHRGGHFPAAVGWSKVGWVSCAAVGLCMMASGLYGACAARISALREGKRGIFL